MCVYICMYMWQFSLDFHCEFEYKLSQSNDIVRFQNKVALLLATDLQLGCQLKSDPYDCHVHRDLGTVTY